MVAVIPLIRVAAAVPPAREGDKKRAREAKERSTCQSPSHFLLTVSVTL